jgi:hypothetical protein
MVMVADVFRLVMRESEDRNADVVAYFRKSEILAYRRTRNGAGAA